MSYSPTTWKQGDVVTSAKLNNIENGIVSGYIVPIFCTTDSVSMTYAELASLLSNNELTVPIAIIVSNEILANSTLYSEDDYLYLGGTSVSVNTVSTAKVTARQHTWTISSDGTITYDVKVAE